MEGNGKMWLLIGAGVLVVLFLMKRGGSSVTQLQAPDTSGETAARYGFADSGLRALADAFSVKVTSDAQVASERSRDAAYTESARIYGDVENVRSATAERVALSQYNAQLAGIQAQASASVANTKAQHKNDWTNILPSVIDGIVSLFS